MKRLNAGEAYDLVADEYDTAFCSNVSKAEDIAVYAFVKEYIKKNGYTLDLGCGTGALLENVHVAPWNYLGIDLSKNMIIRAVRKFPKYRFACLDMLTFTHLIADNVYDNIISLFGGISYVDTEIYSEINRILRPGGLFMLMLFNEKYKNRPTYILRKHGLEVPFKTYNDVRNLLPPHVATGLNFEGDKLCRLPKSLLAIKYGLEMLSFGLLIPTKAYFTLVIGEKIA